MAEAEKPSQTLYTYIRLEAKRGNKELPWTLILPAVRELFAVALLSQRALGPIRRLKALSK